MTLLFWAGWLVAQSVSQSDLNIHLSFEVVLIYHVQAYNNNTGQQNLTFFFFRHTRGKVSNPNRTFNAEFKYVSSFSPSPMVFL